VAVRDEQTTRHEKPANGTGNVFAGKKVLLSADLEVFANQTSLSLPGQLPVDTWREIGDQIQLLSNSSAWWIGDWILYGQASYPDRYRNAMAETSLDYQTLRNYAWIARRFPPRRRRAKLSFQHHVEVASLPPSEQDHWLDLAERFSWSRNELRRQIRSSAEVDFDGSQSSVIRLNLDLDTRRLASWRLAAKEQGSNLTDWMTRTLDQACTTQRPRAGSSGS
jgi:hypothetical protein